jgi:hypothetical protein
MKENGKMVGNMVEENIYYLMDKYVLVFGKMVKGFVGKMN